MPRLTQAVPKYRRHRGSGQAIVTLAGRDHYLGKFGSKASRMLYDRLIAEYLATGRSSITHEEEAGISVVEVLAAFWKHAKQYYVKNGEPTTEQGAYKVIIRDVRKLYGDEEAAAFGPKALKTMRQIWVDRGLVRGTVNQNCRKLVRLFRWAAAEEIIPHTIPDRLATVSGLRKGRTEAPESAPVLPVGGEVVQATLAQLSATVRDMVRVQLLTGMRPNEVCNLRPGDLDRSKEVWEYRPASHKTEHHGRARVVFIGPEAQQILASYVARPPGSYCFDPREAVEQWREQKHAARTTPLSCGNRPSLGLTSKRSKDLGDHYTTSSYRRAIHRACDRAFTAPEPLAKQTGESSTLHRARLSEQQWAELRAWQSKHRWSPNQLRHTAATEIRKQFGLEAAQVILGHAAADVTQVYAERDLDKAREVARQCG